LDTLKGAITFTAPHVKIKHPPKKRGAVTPHIKEKVEEPIKK